MDNKKAHEDQLLNELKILQVQIGELESLGSDSDRTEVELRKRQLQLEAILNNIPDIAWLKDKNSRFICVNEAFGRACGVLPRELVGRIDLDIWPKDLAERYRADDREVMESKTRKRVEEPLADKEGKVKWIETIKTPISNDKGEVIGTTGIARDITERKILEDKLRQAHAELEIRVKVRTAELAKTNEDLVREVAGHKAAVNALKVSELKYRSIFESVPVSIWEEDFSKVVELLEDLRNQNIIDFRGYLKEHPEFIRKAVKLVRVIDVNDAGLKIYAAKTKEELFRSLDIVFTEESYPVFAEELVAIAEGKDYFESECVNKTLDGKEKTMIIRIAIPAEKDKFERLIITLADITTKKEAEKIREDLNKELIVSNQRLKKLALTDSHTGLFNHRYLGEVIEAEFHRSKRFAYPLSVIMLDIDYFKSINDVYGHQFGDLVLKQFAIQLKRLVRRYDIVVRFGGEEFIIISPSIDKQQALSLAQRLLDALNLYNFGDNKHSVKLKISIAIANYPDDAASKGMDLVNTADQVLNKAKESGGNRVFTASDAVDHNQNGRASRQDIKELKVKINKLTRRANQSLVEAILAFAKTIELKDHYTGEHVESTVYYATEIAKALNLPKEEIELVREAAMLHDLGKIGISENILHKKSKLTRKEFEEIKQHPQIGADILRPIQFLHPIIPLILYHHEKWDGSGYPNGLKAEEIPLGARIIAIADVYQALTSDRPYRKAFAKATALKIMRENSGKQFDPQIVDVFMKILEKEKAPAKRQKK